MHANTVDVAVMIADRSMPCHFTALCICVILLAPVYCTKLTYPCTFNHIHQHSISNKSKQNGKVTFSDKLALWKFKVNRSDLGHSLIWDTSNKRMNCGP